MGKASHVIAVVNQKGGVGKTTSAVNLAACFAATERRTLLIDLDPQGNASSAYGIVNSPQHVYDVLIGAATIEEAAVETAIEYLQVLPSGPDLVGAEIELVSREAREHQLAQAIARAHDRYELVVIDCPPSLGLLTLNALTAADSLLIPLQCEYYALEGLARLMETTELVQQNLNPGLQLLGIVLTMVDMRNNLARQVEAEVRRHFGDKVYRTRIPRNVRLSEAPSHGQPIILYDIHSKGAVAYLKLAEEILEKAPFAASRNTIVSAGTGSTESAESMRQVIVDAGASASPSDSDEVTHPFAESEGEGRS
jgi:chromosome partitioning protein